MEGAYIQAYLVLSVVILASQCNGLAESDPRPGVTIKPSPSILVVHKRSSLLLNCSAVSEPDYGPITYSWMKNGKPFSTSKRVQMMKENGSLYFQHIKRKKRMNDEGTYTCLMKNSKGTVIGREVQLKVARISRSFNKEPHDQEATVGGVARFECNINATTSPIYVWHKDDDLLHSNERVTKLQSGVLQIHNVQVEDAGLYSCSVSYSFQGSHASRPTVHWRNSDEGTLTVIEDNTPRPPRIVSFKQEVNVVAKETVTLECLVDGSPMPTVEWFKEELSSIDVKTIMMPVEMDVLKVVRGYSNLEFKEVDVNDAGTYHCKATSGRDEAKAIITLHVNEPPTLVLSPKSVVVEIARRVRLPCVVRGRPKPQISWYQNSKLIRANGHFNIAKNNELRIETTYEDTGYYQCVARNSVGYTIATAHVKVNQQDCAPEPPQNLEIKVLSSHDLYIHWNSSRLPENCEYEIVAYTLHSREVDPASKYQTEIVTNTSFRLNGLHPYTEYEFYVMAYTKEGASRASDKKRAITKEGIPDAAPKINMVNVNPSTINLSWEALPVENRNGQISKYRILYKTKDVPLYSVEVAGDETGYVLQGLHANTTYSVLVLAGTTMGYPSINDDWVWTDHTTMHNNGTLQFPPIISIEVTAVTSTMALIHWSASNVTRPITGYKMLISKYSNKNKSVIQRVFDADTTSFNVSGLGKGVHTFICIDIIPNELKSLPSSDVSVRTWSCLQIV